MPAATVLATPKVPEQIRQRSSDLLLLLPKLRAARKTIPKHEYANGHQVLAAFKKYSNERRLRSVAKTFQASGEVACARIREFAWDLGAETDWGWGWIAESSRCLGLSYTTTWNIISGGITSISTRTVDHVARVSGVPVRVFYDAEI